LGQLRVVADSDCLQHLTITIAGRDEKYNSFTNYHFQSSYRINLGEFSTM